MEADLVSTKVSAAPGTTIPAQLQELQTLLKDSSPTAASTLASSLHFKYGGLSHWPLRLLDGCVEALRNLNALSTPSTEVVRASRLYAELLAETAEHAGNGCMNDVMLSWLSFHDLDWMKSALGSSPQSRGGKVYEDHPIWFLSFMVQLVIQGFCSIEILVQDLCGAILSKVANSLQQPSSLMDPPSDSLDDLQHHHHHTVAPEESMLHLCMTMVILLRILLLEDAFSNPRASHAYGASHHALSLEHQADRFGIQLSIAEIHALQTQRSRLVAIQPQTRRELESAGTENNNTSTLTLSLEHRMMLVQFQICRDLVWIESCLPLSHKVLHEIQEYRKDWALSADWLREKCLANVDEAYKMFLQTRQEEPTIESSTGDRMAVDHKSTTTTPHSNSGQSNKKHADVVERKMMETFQMLMAESHESLMLLDNYGEAALTPGMIHQRTLRSIFSRVDRWIFDRCKVEFWLLLDTVMMEHGGRDKRAARNEGPAKNGNVSGSGESSTDGLMMMEGVTMASSTGASSETTNSMGMSDSGMDMSGNGADGDSLQQLIHVFFYEFVLTENADKDLLGRMITGMRSDAVEEVMLLEEKKKKKRTMASIMSQEGSTHIFVRFFFFFISCFA